MWYDRIWVNRRRLLRLGLLALLAWYALFGGEYPLHELWSMRERHAVVNAEIAHLRTEIERLTEVRNTLENDPVAVERVAREKFGLIKDREILYRFVGP